ncbi:MFS transporter [Williamsia sterculiae]|uniref:Predicted arabinose efflux permease, MFS family n=1 Tax=Williamsia sterculiae TaxID=1344003 RepID=A0A1N7H9K2_9NOCA|nr:MFS transporter [Williamsia sterculiae]SIS21564.1 Predicted arabinose efflux permease, MFS family [Williamsia sterculiae]
MTTTDRTAPVRYRLGTPAYRRATFALFAAGMTTFMALYYVQALLPVFSEAFGVSPTTSALAVSLTTGFLALSIIPASVLSERYGRVRVMVISAISASIIGLLLPWSPSIEVLLAGRALQGVLCAGVPAVAMAYLAEEVDGASLGTAMGRYVAGTTVGGLTGRLVPSLAVDITSWRWALEIACLVSLAFAVAFWRLVPSSHFFAPKPVSVRSTLQRLRGHLRDVPLLCLFGLAFVLMGGFVTVYNYLGYRLLAGPFHLSQSVIGAVFLLYLAGTVSSGLAGSLSDRIGRRRVLTASIATMVLGLLITLPDNIASTLFGVLLFTAGFFGAHSVASGWVSARATTDRAEASSLYLFAYYLGSSVVGAVGGIAYSVAAWVGVVVYVGALSAVAVALLATLVLRTRRLSPTVI